MPPIEAKSVPPQVVTGRLITLLPDIAAALAFRLACYAAMTWLALWAELRPAPTVPDLLISGVPYIPWIDRVNYIAWLMLYVPLSATFLITLPARWVRYMFTGGVISLLRGVCIAVTGLGPANGSSGGAGMPGFRYNEAFIDLLSPVAIFGRGAAHLFLTKDMFFSGHTATTFLVVLYLWDRPRLRWLALAAHVIVVSTVVFSHLHYAIDILGAYAFTFAVFAYREWRPALQS